jgi:hypothetical protein
MSGKSPGWLRVMVGVAGTALSLSAFFTWTGALSGWSLNAGIAALCALSGLAAILGASTDGRIGVFRPDVSSIAAADLLNVATTLVVAAYLFADLGTDAAGFGVWLALVSAAVAACGSADWRVLKGAPVFPRL